MKRIDHPTAASGLFTDGNPATSTPATVLPSDWLNIVQEELANAIEAAGLTLSGASDNQLTQAISKLATASGGFKNAVVNGDFQVWQRGETFAGIALAETYTADRWAIVADGAGGAGVAQVTRQEFAVGQDEVPGARAHLRYQQTTPSTAGGGRIRTKLEVLEQMADGDVSVSVWLKASSAITVAAKLVNVYGAASTAEVGSEALSVTTTWQLFTFTKALPSIEGQSITAATAHLRLELALPAGSPTLDVARVQLERSALPGSFEVRPVAFETMLCRRYFETSYPIGTAPGAATAYGVETSQDEGPHLLTMKGRFRVPKRATPTVAWYSPTGALNSVRQMSAVALVDYQVSGTELTSTESTGYPIIPQSFNDERPFHAHWTADAEL